jgi:Dienelactone hydrolase and related enzymes
MKKSVKKYSGVILIVLGMTLAAAGFFNQEQAANEQLLNRARELVKNLSEGNYEEATRNFDQTIKKQATLALLKTVWEGILAQLGEFKGIKGFRFESQRPYDIVYVVCNFARQTMDLRIVFNQQAEISGFTFVPHLEVKESPAPSYARPDLFKETEVQIKTGELVLPGTLTMPVGQGPFPAVVLVHDSGPQDRDETIGPNKPFRDLAWGLATYGIAVLRYEKRTRVYGQKLQQDKKLLTSFTVYEETVDDAVSAVALLSQTPGIRPDRIFVLGHSQGGMMIPRVGQKDRKAAGFIIMAGLTRPLEDAILKQNRYLLSISGLSGEEVKKRLEELENKVAKIKSLTGADANSAEVILGAAPAYWLDLRGYNPVEEARKIDKPLLIIQGKRDYQVIEEDFEAWKKGLKGKAKVTFKLYPDCNHFFLEGKGLITPDEYLYRAGNVSEEVVKDIAGWIKSLF